MIQPPLPMRTKKVPTTLATMLIAPSRSGYTVSPKLWN